VLTKQADGTAQWSDPNKLLDPKQFLAYGVEWDVTVRDP